MSDSDSTPDDIGSLDNESVEPPTPRSEGKLARLLLLILYGLIYQISEVVWFAVTVFQAGSMLLTDKRNDRVNEFSIALTDYMYQVIAYVCQRSDDKPWPLNDAQPTIEIEQ